jgi:hypothetical protein
MIEGTGLLPFFVLVLAGDEQAFILTLLRGCILRPSSVHLCLGFANSSARQSAQFELTAELR